MKILLLGGTAEAREMVPALAAHDLTLSLAGLTEAPDPDVPLVTGGFGGASGLAATLRREAFDLLIDATHPFAARMKAQAAEAAGEAGLPCLHLIRPPWTIAGAVGCADAGAAAKALPPGARPFLALGARHLEGFAARSDLAFVVRSMNRQTDRPPFTFVTGRPPFTPAGEKALFARLGITHLVARNSGGGQGLAKFEAAAALGIRVLLLRRPPPPQGLVFDRPEALLAYLEVLV